MLPQILGDIDELFSLRWHLSRRLHLLLLVHLVLNYRLDLTPFSVALIYPLDLLGQGHRLLLESHNFIGCCRSWLCGKWLECVVEWDFLSLAWNIVHHFGMRFQQFSLRSRFKLDRVESEVLPHQDIWWSALISLQSFQGEFIFDDWYLPSLLLLSLDLWSGGEQSVLIETLHLEHIRECLLPCLPSGGHGLWYASLTIEDTLLVCLWIRLEPAGGILLLSS